MSFVWQAYAVLRGCSMWLLFVLQGFLGNIEWD